MPDITMCRGEGCPMKDRCYRYTAIPTPRRQAWFLNPPIKPDGTCGHLMNNAGYPTPPPANPAPGCDHGLVFDEEEAFSEGMTADQVRLRFPRLDGTCPKGCGYVGIAYVSNAHFVYGDW